MSLVQELYFADLTSNKLELIEHIKNIERLESILGDEKKLKKELRRLKVSRHDLEAKLEIKKRCLDNANRRFEEKIKSKTPEEYLEECIKSRREEFTYRLKRGNKKLEEFESWEKGDCSPEVIETIKDALWNFKRKQLSQKIKEEGSYKGKEVSDESDIRDILNMECDFNSENYNLDNFSETEIKEAIESAKVGVNNDIKRYKKEINDPRQSLREDAKERHERNIEWMERLGIKNFKEIDKILEGQEGPQPGSE